MELTNRARILMAMRGETPDVIPFAPRLDLWYWSNKMRGTLPKQYENAAQDEISRGEGWALHKINPHYQNVRRLEDHLHWGLGIMSFREMVFNYRFSSDVDIDIQRDEKQGRTRITYHTPKGSVTSSILFTEQMRADGSTAFMIDEYAVKSPKDYAPLAHIFENLTLVPDWDDFVQWKAGIGEDGVAFTMSSRAASPMHHVQKYLIDATDFFYHYRDHAKELSALADSLGNFYQQAMDIIAESPAEAVYWGANFDDMLTFAEYFAKDISPWIKKAADKLGPKGIIVSCHCDGENRGLMDLIRDSGMHVAEAVCPAPMTKVDIAEYYQRWSDRLTIFGGIPSNLLLAETASEEEFEAYLTHMFKSVAPGKRMVFGVADSVPPGAVFSRLQRIAERVAKEARLPMAVDPNRKMSFVDAAPAAKQTVAQAPAPAESDSRFGELQQAVLSGDEGKLCDLVNKYLAEGLNADQILDKGMLPAMDIISGKFKDGSVFIPEVLLSARALNAATAVLEPYLAGEKGGGGKVVIGTVNGDLHDIGKNIVAIMLKGVGFEVIDIGINVPAQGFVDAVREHQPDILGMSSLLTTTMPQMQKVIAALSEAGLRKSVKIVVGGAPVNQHYAEEITADGYAADAGDAVQLLKSLLAG